MSVTLLPYIDVDEQQFTEISDTQNDISVIIVKQCNPPTPRALGAGSINIYTYTHTRTHKYLPYIHTTCVVMLLPLYSAISGVMQHTHTHTHTLIYIYIYVDSTYGMLYQNRMWGKWASIYYYTVVWC